MLDGLAKVHVNERTWESGSTLKGSEAQVPEYLGGAPRVGKGVGDAERASGASAHAPYLNS